MARWGAYRRSKWTAVSTKCASGNWHKSGWEARRCDELHAMQAAGLIDALEAHPQPKFDLDVNKIHITSYSPDFRYTDRQSGQTIVEDVKGRPGRTREYELKKRLMLACHEIEILETKPRGA